jgi:outer membrane protein TolC
MRYPKFSGTVFALLVTLTGGVRSQEVSMRLEECVSLGLERSKPLHSSVLRAEFAEAKAREISAGLYPSLKLQAGYTQLSEVPEFKIPLPGSIVAFPVILDTYSTRLSLQQPLFTGWKLQGAVNQAEYNAEAARMEVERDRTELIYSIKQAYWNLYRAQAVRRVMEENLAALATHLEDANNLLKQGMLTMNEVLRVRVQHSQAELMEADAENQVEIARLALNSLIGISLETRVLLASQLTPTTKEYPALKELLDRAVSNRAEMRSALARVRAAEAGVTSAKGGWFPQVVLLGGYTYARPNPRVFPAKDEFKDTWDLGVMLQFDVWNNLTSLHQVTAARTHYEQMKDAHEGLRDAITLDVTQSYLNYQQAQRRIVLAELSLNQAAESYRITSEKFKLGLSLNADLLDAEVALLQAKLQLTQAHVEHELAHARLNKAIGEIP